MASLRRFDIGSISKKLNGINARISVANSIPFPCLNLLSFYQFKKGFVKVLSNGDVQGGFSRMIISLIDFSFVRSLTAHLYTMKSPPPYDPVSLFLLELPVTVVNMAGNGKEGEKIIDLTKQIRAHHDCRTKIDIADAKYDNTDNYTFLRENGSIPIIDYNVRRENLTAKALREREYDRNGWPYAPCDILTRPNGFDADRKRLTFCCMKQGLNLKAQGIRNLDKTYDIGSCEHLNKTCGYTTHSSVDQHPRLLNEIPRGTSRYNDIKRCRSASERSNSTIKETLNILEKPSF